LRSRVKLRQNGIVSFPIKLAAFQASGGARMNLHHLLQKCSFFLIKLAAVQASGNACMKLHVIQCHFREIPNAVAEGGLRPRRRPRTRPSSPIKF
jgi:hypothetical protein